MEVEVTAAPAETGGEVGTQLDLQAMLDGEPPASSSPAETTPTPEGQEPQEPVEAKSEEPVEAKSEEGKPAEQTAEEFSEPLPGKLGKLLETLGKDQKTADLARQLRADHEALNGPEGFRGMFRTVEEAREYKTVAPTVDDLKVMADYAQRYDLVDRQYVGDPVGLIRTLAEDQQAFGKVAESFEPALRQLNDERLYESAAKPFNQNFWRNVMGTVQREGTPDEVELFKAFEQKYLGGLSQGQSQPSSQFQGTPEWRELQQLREQRETFERERGEAFFESVKEDSAKVFHDEIRKHVAEKLGEAAPKDDVDDATREAETSVWNFINTNNMVKSRLAREINGGDKSPQHRKQVFDLAMAYARARMQEASVPVIRRWNERIRVRQGGNGNAPTTTTTTARSKDVGSGSPTVGTGKTGPMPKGAPAGFNNMSQADRAQFVNWDRMGEDADEIFIKAQMSGDWSKVVMKGH